MLDADEPPGVLDAVQPSRARSARLLLGEALPSATSRATLVSARRIWRARYLPPPDPTLLDRMGLVVATSRKNARART